MVTKQAYEQAQIGLANVELSIEKLQQTLLELNLNYNDKLVGFQNSHNSNYEQLTAQIAAWEQQYLLGYPPAAP